MIINTGSRTDIPAFFSKWFYNRIDEGFVMVRNPYCRNLITRYRLSPDVVDAITFCTKNPFPMIKNLHKMAAFNQFWFVTITPYGHDIEPHVPDKYQILQSVTALSEKVGKHSLAWRYDPVLISDKYTASYHLRAFEKIAGILSGYVNFCVVSFIDLYEKTKRNFPQVREVTKEEQFFLTEKFVQTAQHFGIPVKLCCENSELKQFGADTSGCMTKEILEKAIGYNLKLPKDKKPARTQCRCLLGDDIGEYNSCGHGCIYCYANYDNCMVQRNMSLHDPNSPLLIGKRDKNDIVRDAVQVPFKDEQIRFF